MSTMDAVERISVALGRAVRGVEPDVVERIRQALDEEVSKEGRMVLSRILEDIEVAGKTGLPLCQDCGMFWCLVEVGRSCRTPLDDMEAVINTACRKAVADYSFRRSVVEDPVFTRKNTGDNMPPVIHWSLVDGEDVTISFLLKGFGSENCSGVRMLRPTDGPDGVVSAVVDLMKAAGGKPCPPVFLGVGIGGTMDRAAFLSKKALLRPVGQHSTDEDLASLEERILGEVNKLGIGPGGLGGTVSCLALSIEADATHIAGLPVALSVNCWADRRAVIHFKGGVLC